MSAKSGADAPGLVLFRDDLRIADNRALAAAADSGRPVAALYVLDEEASPRLPGAAVAWWLNLSLKALAKDLEKHGVSLALRSGKGSDIVPKVVREIGAGAVFWNRRYDPVAVEADTRLKASLRDDGIEARSFDGRLLHEPPLLKTGTGGFYKVYTPFWKALTAQIEPRDPVDAPRSIKPWKGTLKGESIDALLPLPQKPDWAGGLRERWTPGEKGAQAALKRFLDEGVKGYKSNRDRPDMDGTSSLSPHLAHGEITPYQIFAALRDRRLQGDDATTFRKEVVWREFAHHLAFHAPPLHDKNFRPEFDGFEWKGGSAGLTAWQKGLTGYPIVDAGMRQLWQTGWMHNRIRMVVASFLIKDLRIDWRKGEQWFWDTLVDADPAQNPFNWQWVAGSGADASPFFRIFNPMMQGERFDPDGAYVRHFVPELAALPDRFIHKPWEAPTLVLREAGVTLGKTYPKPIVDHQQARDEALAAYKAMSGPRSEERAEPS